MGTMSFRDELGTVCTKPCSVGLARSGERIKEAVADGFRHDAYVVNVESPFVTLNTA